MHRCPECDGDCDCHGDIDDCDVMDLDWVIEHCVHDCDEFEISRWEDYLEDEGRRMLDEE